MRYFLTYILLTYIFFLIGSGLSQAQIGYQVALINNATGEPRTLETVIVELSIADSQENQIYSTSQKATTNDFGILSLTIGDANTFDNVDWSKLPLFISAKVNGQLLGKSQILNVPVAEYAKRTGTLTPEILCRSPFSYKSPGFNMIMVFNNDGTAKLTTINMDSDNIRYYEEYLWKIYGDVIILSYEKNRAIKWTYLPDCDAILDDWEGRLYTR